jgi:hypothetical protein
MDLRVLTADKVQVYVLFYKPSASDPYLNRFVAYWDGPFSHCELAIPERVGEEPWDRIMWGSSIYQDETVFYHQKTYKRDGYVSIALEVTIPQLHSIRSFCRHHAERKTGFSLPAMYAAYLPFQFVQTDLTFCSKHVADALNAGAVPEVADVNPALMTPSRLYKRLSRTAISRAIPARMPTVRAAGREALVRFMQQTTSDERTRRAKSLPPRCV